MAAKKNLNSTKWNIEPSFKFDALCFINILTGNEFYLTYHLDEYEKFKGLVTPAAMASLENLIRILKTENEIIISAWLCLYFSAVEDSTIEEMISTCNDPQALKLNFEKSPYFSNENWIIFDSILNDLKIILEFLLDIDFPSHWRKNILPNIESKISEIKKELPAYDVIKENELFLGFKLPSNKITVFVLNYVRPHGVKITGTRFLTDIAWPFKIVLRTAVHEMMHPPYDFNNDTELRLAILSLENDSFIMDKVQNHNKSFGYNTLEGLIEEDCVQTLEQLINEKLGIAKDARERWKTQDDGIHVFAVALYQVMKEENYNNKNELFRNFLIRMINSGKLMAGKINGYSGGFLK